MGAFHPASPLPVIRPSSAPLHHNKFLEQADELRVFRFDGFLPTPHEHGSPEEKVPENAFFLDLAQPLCVQWHIPGIGQ